MLLNTAMNCRMYNQLLDAAPCYKLMNRRMGTPHAIRPARQTPNALLDTATYSRNHNYELDAACCYKLMNMGTSHAIIVLDMYLVAIISCYMAQCD